MVVRETGQGASASAAARRENPQIKALDSQIADLRQKIKDANANDKLDARTKAEKVKEYQQNIQVLQQQKVQLQNEERQRRFEAAKEKQSLETARPQGEEQGVLKDGAHLQNTAVELDSLKTKITVTGSVRTKAKAELRLEESKAYRPMATTADPAKAAAIRRRIDKMDNDLLTGAAKSLKEISKSAEDTALREEKAKDEAGKKNGSGTGRMEPGQFLDDEG